MQRMIVVRPPGARPDWPTRACLFVMLLSLTGCKQPEEPQSSRDAQAAEKVALPAESAPSTTSAAPLPAAPQPAPTAAAERVRCMVATPEQAPKPEKPAANCPKEVGIAPDWSRGALFFPDAPGAPRLAVELARTPHEHEHGLMFRKHLPEEQGMLFEWQNEEPRTFWMHNTCIPLDMLFIAKDGLVVGILEQVPALNDDPRGVPCSAAYVLETNAGWCRRHGVKAGQHMKLD